MTKINLTEINQLKRNLADDFNFAVSLGRPEDSEFAAKTAYAYADLVLSSITQSVPIDMEEDMKVMQDMKVSLVSYFNALDQKRGDKIKLRAENALAYAQITRAQRAIERYI